jgi:diadenosine tetraphosphate (Ap4A) HIT family hydrolase
LKELQEYKIIHEDKEENGFILNYAIDPEVDGHLVVQPKFHVEQLSDLCEEQARRLMEIIFASCKALQSLYSPDKIYVYSFNEAKGYHLHVHVKPRSRNIQVKGPCFVNWKDRK